MAYLPPPFSPGGSFQLELRDETYEYDIVNNPTVAARLCVFADVEGAGAVRAVIHVGTVVVDGAFDAVAGWAANRCVLGAITFAGTGRDAALADTVSFSAAISAIDAFDALARRRIADPLGAVVLRTARVVRFATAFDAMGGPAAIAVFQACDAFADCEVTHGVVRSGASSGFFALCDFATGAVFATLALSAVVVEKACDATLARVATSRFTIVVARAELAFGRAFGWTAVVTARKRRERQPTAEE